MIFRNWIEHGQEDNSQGVAAAPSPRGGLRGQAFVEFAMILPIAALVLLGSIQLSMLANVYLALNQAAYAGARYAAVNPTADQTAVASYVKSVASPTLLSNSGNDLNVAMTPNSPPQRTLGSSVTVTLTYDTTSKLFFRGIGLPKLQLPNSLSSTNSSFSE